MKLWYFTEQQYHPGWEKISGPIRNTPPTSAIDPEIAADLIDRYYEEYQALDSLGLNIAVNEHHSSFQSMSCATFLSVAAIARVTKRARILSIGTPIAQRTEPVRVAEEIALADVMSRGRTEAGLIKSVPWEYFNSNANPMGVMVRFWEAHDLILKALSTRDGPFSWSGEHFHYRNVNVVPRPYQDPHPPIWITGQSSNSARAIAARGHVAVTSQSGTRNAASYYAAYRDEYFKVHARPAPDDRLAYLCYIAIGKTEDEARAIAERVHSWVVFLGSQNNAFQHAAGYAPAADFARLLRAGSGGVSPYVNFKPPSIDKMREDGVFFFGTSAQVFDQITGFMERTGRVGHLLMQMGGYATQDDTIGCMTRVANELKPRLEEWAAKAKLPSAQRTRSDERAGALSDPL